MSYKYSALLTTICVTFMYGLALPELFPIAALTFFNYYTVDKFLITYFYQRPPLYDDKLNKTALELMKFGPIIMLIFGYYWMGNMQIFSDRVVPLVNQSIPITTDHGWYPTHDTNQALPLFIVGLTVLIGSIFDDLVVKCLKKANIMQEDEEYVVDEKLGTYFQCISVWDRKAWLAQEVHSSQDLGISTMGKWTMEMLRTAHTGSNRVVNAPNYEVLASTKYQTQFQFTPIERCDTPEELAVSDTILKVLYMGYTRDGYTEFDFKKAHASVKKRVNKFRKKKAVEDAVEDAEA